MTRGTEPSKFWSNFRLDFLHILCSSAIVVSDRRMLIYSPIMMYAMLSQKSKSTSYALSQPIVLHFASKQKNALAASASTKCSYYTLYSTLA